MDDIQEMLNNIEQNSTQLYRCNKCGVDKTKSEFYYDPKYPNGVHSPCKMCRKVYSESPEQRQRISDYNKAVRRKNPKLVMYRAAKKRAKELSIPFSITLQDIYLPPTCPILGVKLEIGDKYNLPNSPSLDRIKPNLGYVPGNICVLSWRANKLKSNATIEELRALIAYIKSFDRVNIEKQVVTVRFESQNKEPKYPKVDNRQGLQIG